MIANLQFVLLDGLKCYIKNEVDFMSEYVKISNEQKYYRIGLNIAYQRKLKKLTQIQLAEKIGISRTHMSNIEAPNMLTPVSIEVIFNIADALEIPVDLLFKFN